MKITSIDVFLVTIGRPSVLGSPWNPVVVRINTDEGISGYGEVGLCYGDTKEAPFGMCRDFAKLIIGMACFQGCQGIRGRGRDDALRRDGPGNARSRL